MSRVSVTRFVARALAPTLVAACLATAGQARADTVLYAFGDSLVDTGNVFALYGGQFPPPPYFEGRVSNGPVFVEVMADRLGLARPTPSSSGGTNFAFAGARTGMGTSPLLFPGVPPQQVQNVGEQVKTFLDAGGMFGADDLVLINGGGNDLLDVLLLGTTPDPIAWASNLAASVGELVDAGGRRIMVANLPLIGQTPLLLGLDPSNPGLSAQFDALSIAFNRVLDAQLDALEQSTPGLELYRLDLAELLTSAIVEPDRYGFSNVTDRVFNVTGLAGDPDTFLFWDDFHPTAAGHRYIGDAAARLVPEPSSLALAAMGSALGLAAAIRRRRAA